MTGEPVKGFHVSLSRKVGDKGGRVELFRETIGNEEGCCGNEVRRMGEELGMADRRRLDARVHRALGLEDATVERLYEAFAAQLDERAAMRARVRASHRPVIWTSRT